MIETRTSLLQNLEENSGKKVRIWSLNPCKYGHLAGRRSNRQCRECYRIGRKVYWAKPENKYRNYKYRLNKRIADKKARLERLIDEQKITD